MTIYTLFLISLTSISVVDTTCVGNTDCCIDSLTKECVYSIVDIMPVYAEGDGNIQFMKDIYKALSLSNSSKLAIEKREITSTSIMLQFVITKRGKLIGARIANKDTTDPLEKDLLEAIVKLNSKWSPGVLGDKKVSVMYYMPIHLEVR